MTSVLLFFIIAPIWPLDIIDTSLKGKQHFIDQGSFYLPIITLWTIGCVIAGISKNERFHGVWAILFSVSQISYTTIQLLKLG